MSAVGRRGVGPLLLRVNRLVSQLTHQPHHAFTIDLVALGLEPVRQATAAIEGGTRVLLVQKTQQGLVFAFMVRVFLALIVEAGTRQSQQLALARQADVRMAELDLSALLFNTPGQTWQLFF